MTRGERASSTYSSCRTSACPDALFATGVRTSFKIPGDERKRFSFSIVARFSLNGDPLPRRRAVCERRASDAGSGVCAPCAVDRRTTGFPSRGVTLQTRDVGGAIAAVGDGSFLPSIASASGDD